MSAEPQMGMSIPVICLERQRDVWASARLSFEDEGSFLLVKSPVALDQVVALSHKIGPAILLAASDFIDFLNSHDIRHLGFIGTLYVLVVTFSDADDAALERYIRCGCSGVLSLSDGPEIWRKAVRSVVAGELWIPRRTSARVFRELLQLEDHAQSRRLTPREAEILELIGSGHTNREIATQLFITKETVRWHVRTLYSKLGVKGREGAIELCRSQAVHTLLKAR